MLQRISAALEPIGGPFAAALYCAAVLAIVAWGVIGAVGWWLAQPDLVTRVAAIALHVAALVFASCALKLAAPKFARLATARFGILLAFLGIISICVTAYGGHQGLVLNEQRRWADREAFEATLPALTSAEAQLADITTEIEALAPVPLVYPDGRPIGVNTRDRLIAERNRALDRLTQREGEARIAVAAATQTPVPAPGTRMSSIERFVMTFVFEAIEVFAFWGISAALAKSGQLPDLGTSKSHGTGQRQAKRRTRRKTRFGPAIALVVDAGKAVVPLGRRAWDSVSQAAVPRSRDDPAELGQQLQRAIALKAANPRMSYRAIEDTTGVPKSTLQRHWKRMRGVSA